MTPDIIRLATVVAIVKKNGSLRRSDIDGGSKLQKLHRQMSELCSIHRITQRAS